MINYLNSARLLVLCFFLTLSLRAQINEIYVPQYIAEEWQDSLLSFVSTPSLEPGSDLPIFLKEQITGYCQEDRKCLWESYLVVVDELNALKMHFEGIPLADELARMAKEDNNIDGEILAVGMLNRFYGTIWDKEVRSQLILRLIDLYEAKGDVGNVLYYKTIVSEGKAFQLGQVEEAITELKELLAQATELNLEKSRNKILTRQKILYESFGYTEELPPIVEELEQIPLSDPIQHTEYEYAYHAWAGRADLLLLEQDYDAAETRYQKVLTLAKTRFGGKGDLWREIDIIQRLAKLEWARGNKSKAYSYMEEASLEAQRFNMHDHIPANLNILISFTEEDQRYADALVYTRQLHTHQRAVDSVANYFDEQRYYTQLAGGVQNSVSRAEPQSPQSFFYC